MHVFLPKREVLFTITILFFVGCSDENLEERPPNIILILIDDLGWADLPAYGNQFHETPNIDRMAREGMRFVNAYAAAPVCSPTRASIQSGQYPARVGVTDYITGHWRPYERFLAPKNRTQYLPLEVKTVAESLKDAGYRTGYFGKWHLDHLFEDGYGPWDQGYDEAIVSRGGHFDMANRLKPPQEVAPEAYLADILTQRSLEFMEANRDTSFFLMLSHYAVHIPLHAKDSLIQKYENKPKPRVGINHPVYAAMIEHVDESVGRILGGLKDLGLDDNTLVVFFSDNGGLRQSFNKTSDVVTTNAPLRDEKGTLYEGGIRVPMIVRWPGVVSGGGVSEEVVSSIDLYPTFLEAAGAQSPPDWTLDGVSLLPALRQEQTLPERPLFFHYPHYHHSSPAGAVRQGDYKLIEFFDEDRVELYNISEDISETTNLAEQEPQKTAELRQLLESWRETVSAELPVPNPDFDEQRRHEWGRHPDRQPG